MVMTVLGTVIATEFQNPVRTPSQAAPVHTAPQASRQGASVNACGSARMPPWRISAIGLNEVTIITYSGSRKNSAAIKRKAYTPSRPTEKRRRLARAGAEASAGTAGDWTVVE